MLVQTNSVIENDAHNVQYQTLMKMFLDTWFLEN